jgi:hypothetical protein
MAFGLKFLKTIVSVKAGGKSRLDWAQALTSCGLWLAVSAEATAAVPLTTARIGVGPSLVQTQSRDLTTWGSYGAFRLGALQERLNLIAGLDLTAYRIQDAPDKGLRYDIHGNDVLFFLGYARGSWTLWGGVGAGQMRIYDRDVVLDEDEDDKVDTEFDDRKAHRSISQVTEAEL